MLSEHSRVGVQAIDAYLESRLSESVFAADGTEKSYVNCKRKCQKTPVQIYSIVL